MQERHQVAREVQLHSRLCHDSIIAMYAAWQDKDYVFILLEWAAGVRAWGGTSNNPGTSNHTACLPAWPLCCTAFEARTHPITRPQQPQPKDNPKPPNPQTSTIAPPPAPNSPVCWPAAALSVCWPAAAG